MVFTGRYNWGIEDSVGVKSSLCWEDKIDCNTCVYWSWDNCIEDCGGTSWNWKDSGDNKIGGNSCWKKCVCWSACGKDHIFLKDSRGTCWKDGGETGLGSSGNTYW